MYINEDRCPKCDSENIEFGPIEVTGFECVYYPIECKDCEFTGRQWYNLKFAGYSGKDGEMVEK